MSRNRALILVALVVLAMLPAYLSAMMVSGPSDAPTLLLGDRVLVNRASFQVNLPYTGVRLFWRSVPKRGDMVLFYVPKRGISGLKRIAGLPGDTIELRENELRVNGEAVQQQPLDRAKFAPWIPDEHKLGERVARESTGNWITYTPGLSGVRNMGKVKVAADEYFLLGDHRDNSNDSRIFGPVPMRYIHGRVLGHLTSARPRTMLPVW